MVQGGLASCLLSLKQRPFLVMGEIEDNCYENIAYMSKANFSKITYSVVGADGVSKSRQDERNLDYFLDPAVFESALKLLVST